MPRRSEDRRDFDWKAVVVLLVVAVLLVVLFYGEGSLEGQAPARSHATPLGAGRDLSCGPGC